MAEAPRPAAAAPSSPRATDGDADWFVERPPYAREPTVERIARETKHRLYYGPVREARVGHREEQLYVMTLTDAQLAEHDRIIAEFFSRAIAWSEAVALLMGLGFSRLAAEADLSLTEV